VFADEPAARAFVQRAVAGRVPNETIARLNDLLPDHCSSCEPQLPESERAFWKEFYRTHLGAPLDKRL
jgi:hypothetical protein